MLCFTDFVSHNDVMFHRKCYMLYLIFIVTLLLYMVTMCTKSFMAYKPPG